MLYTVRFAFVAIFSFLFLLIKSIIQLPFVKDKKDFFRRGGAAWGKAVVKFTPVDIKVSGVEHISKNQPTLFVSNHQSNIDILFLMGAIPKPFVFVAKIELSKIPVFGWVMKVADHIFINRSNREAAKQSIDQTVKRIKSGDSVAIFPEGTRSATGILGNFKRGVDYIIKDVEVEVVPVVISGSYKMNPKGTKYFNKVPISITFLDPLTNEEKKTENVSQIIRAKISTHLS